MNKTKIAALAIVFAAALLFSGCARYSPSVIRVDIGAPVHNLDPQFATDPTARMVIANLFEGLMVQGPDGQLRLGAAAEYSVSPDGLTYTFILRDDLRWQDGSDVTSRDFVFAFRRIFSPHAPSPFAGEFSAITNATRVLAGEAPPTALGVIARGPQTVVFNLERPAPGFLVSLAHTAAMPCNQSAFEQTMGRYGLAIGYLVSNGPFTLGRWNASQIHLNRSEYFREDEQALSERVILYIGRQDPIRQFLDRRSDMALVPPDRLGEIIERSPQLIPAQVTAWGLVFNQNARPWGNPMLRQSLALTLDPSLYAGDLPAGLTATGMFVPPGALVHGRSFRGGGDESNPLGPDADRARHLFGRGLAAQGYSRLIHFEVVVPEARYGQMGFLSEALMRELGVEITLEPADTEQMAHHLAAGGYAVILLPFHSRGGSPGALLRYFRSEVNRFGYNNPRFDHALDSVGLAVSPEEAVRLYRLAENILLEDAAIIPLFFETTYYAISPSLTGVEMLPFGGGRFQNAQRQ